MFGSCEQRPSSERALSRVRPFTEALLHSRHDLSLPLTTQPTLIHKDKGTATEAAARTNCTARSELFGAVTYDHVSPPKHTLCSMWMYGKHNSFVLRLQRKWRTRYYHRVCSHRSRRLKTKEDRRFSWKIMPENDAFYDRTFDSSRLTQCCKVEC